MCSRCEADQQLPLWIYDSKICTQSATHAPMIYCDLVYAMPERELGSWNSARNTEFAMWWPGEIAPLRICEICDLFLKIRCEDDDFIRLLLQRWTLNTEHGALKYSARSAYTEWDSCQRIGERKIEPHLDTPAHNGCAALTSYFVREQMKCKEFKNNFEDYLLYVKDCFTSSRTTRPRMHSPLCIRASVTLGSCRECIK